MIGQIQFGQEYPGIVALDQNTCANLTVKCLADLGIASRETAFVCLMEVAKEVGQMPEKFPAHSS